MSGGNPISAVSNAFSHALGTDGSHGGLLGIGAQLDKSVRTVIPGGWATVGLAALAIAAPYAAPELFAASTPASAAGYAGDVYGGLAGTVGTGTAVAGNAATAGLTAINAGSAMLAGAQTGALIGGALGGVNSAIRGTDPLKGILAGAIMGGLTGASLADVSNLLANSGVPESMVQPMASALVSASKSIAAGADPLTILQNTALSSGLSQLSSAAKSLIAPDIGTTASNIATSAGTGALGSVIKGGDAGMGALSGAINSAAGQTVGALTGAAKEAYGALTAPSASAAPSDTNAYGPVSPVQTGDPTALQSQYLTAQAQQILEQGKALEPTLAQQQAELATAGSKANDLYTQFNTNKTTLNDAINNNYNPAYANVADLQGKASGIYSQVESLQKTYDDNKAAYEKDSTNTTAFNAANDAASQLNTLIPQYNTAAETFAKANTALESLYNSQIAPLIQTYQTSNNALNDQLKIVVANQNTFQDTAAKYSDVVNNLNTISTGKLVEGMNAPVVSMQAPTNAGFTNEELAAIQQGQQDAAATTGTGSQTAANVTVTNAGDQPIVTDAGSGAPTPYIPPSQVVSTKDQLDEELASGQITQDEYDAGISNLPVTNPDQSTIDQVVLDATINQQSGTSGGTSPVTPEQPVTPTPVEQPVTPTPVEQPVTPTPVEQPVTPTPVEQPVTPTPVEQPVTPNSTPGGIVGGTTDGTGSGTPGGVVGGATDGTVGGTPGGTVDGTPGGVVDGTPGGVVGGTPGGVVGGTPGGVVGGTPGGVVGGTPGGVVGGTTDGTVGGSGVLANTTTTPPTATGGTTTGGGTSTGVGTGIGAGLTMAQILALIAANKGTIPAAVKATPVASTITDLTPGLTKGSAFKFANAPTFSEQVNPVSQQNPPDYTSQIFNAATGGSTTDANTIADLKPGLARGSAFSFSNKPTFAQVQAAQQAQQQQSFPDYTQQILNAASGGLVYNFAEGGQTPEYPESPGPTLSPRFLHGSAFRPMSHQFGAQLPGYRPREFAEGGDVEGHNPQFYSEGGLNTLDNTYVKGAGDGTSDSVPAMLANGEFVIPADVVSKLGNGSNDAGADVLSEFLSTIREHAQNHDPKKLPPESKGALAYLLDAKRKVG